MQLLAGRNEAEQLGAAHAIPEQWLATLTELVARSDLAFACMYLQDGDGRLQRVAATARTPGAEWPLTDALTVARPTLVDGPTLLVPLRLAAEAPGQGVLVAGADPSRVVDEPLIGLLTQIGQHISVMLASAGMQPEADQRVRIMAVLDDALQKFFVIGLVTQAALADLAADRFTDNIGAALTQIIDAATSGREHLRDAIFALTCAEAGQTGLADRLRSLAHRFEQRTGIDAEVVVNGQARSLPAGVSETLEQTAAEALADIERQSKAGAVVLSLRVTARSVTLSVQDDGATIATNCGLRGVGQRVREMGGTFVAKPVREGGFLVRTRLPLGSGSFRGHTGTWPKQTSL